MRVGLVMLVVLAAACSGNSTTPEGHACGDANVLYLSETSATGPLGAYSGKYAGQVELTRKLNREASGLSDGQLRDEIRTVEANVTKAHLANPRYLADMLHVCREKGYLTGG